jgi:heme exporter protein D
VSVWEGIGLTVLIFIAYIWAPVGGLKRLIDSIKEQEKREQEEREQKGKPQEKRSPGAPQ